MKFLLLFLFCLPMVWTYSTNLRRMPNSKPVSRIIGGQLASPGQFPWIAAIYKDTAEGRFFCGGSIVNEQWIMTAAQCVVNATSLTVQVGSTTLTGNDPNRVTLTSTTYVANDRFQPDTMWHDIGVIKLPSPLEFNDYIQPVVMLTTMNPVYQGVPAQMIGWGQTADTGELVNELQFSDIHCMGERECQAYFGDQIKPSMICTQGDSNQGPCYGDIGGPLMIPAPIGNHTIQVGISSFVSQNGCESEDPKGYTRTDAYYAWMMGIIKDNS